MATSNTRLLTRRNIGPLSSDGFSQPSSCNTPWIEGIDAGQPGFWYAASCTMTKSAVDPLIRSDAACYPSPWVAQAAYGFLIDVPFCSPARICPTGFTSACNVTRNVFDSVPSQLTYNAPAASTTLDVLTDGETAVGCCPTGFSCDDGRAGSCTKSFSSTDIVPGVTYGRSCVVSSVTATLSDFTAAFVVSSTPSALQVVLVHNPANDNQNTPSGTTGLSTGAKLAIGLEVPLGFLAIVAVIFIFRHRSKKVKRSTPRQSNPSVEPVLPPHLTKSELKGSEVLTSSTQLQSPVQEKSELDTRPTAAIAATGQTATEMGPSRPTARGRAELDQEPSAVIRDIAELDSRPYRHELDG